VQVQIDTKQKSHFLILLQIVTVVKELNVGTLVPSRGGPGLMFPLLFMRAFQAVAAVFVEQVGLVEYRIARTVGCLA